MKQPKKKKVLAKKVAKKSTPKKVSKVKVSITTRKAKKSPNKVIGTKKTLSNKGVKKSTVKMGKPSPYRIPKPIARQTPTVPREISVGRGKMYSGKKPTDAQIKAYEKKHAPIKQGKKNPTNSTGTKANAYPSRYPKGKVKNKNSR